MKSRTLLVHFWSIFLLKRSITRFWYILFHDLLSFDVDVIIYFWPLLRHLGFKNLDLKFRPKRSRPDACFGAVCVTHQSWHPFFPAKLLLYPWSSLSQCIVFCMQPARISEISSLICFLIYKVNNIKAFCEIAKKHLCEKVNPHHSNNVVVYVSF